MKKLILTLALFFMPAIAHAETTSVDSLLKTTIPNWIDYLIGIAFTLALLFFIWGIATFILKSGAEEARDEGKRKMLWGITALFVITAIWGIVRFIESSLGIQSDQNINVPAIPGRDKPSGSTGGTIPLNSTRITDGATIIDGPTR